MLTLTINGTDHQLDVGDDMPLLWAIRDIVGLTGTKFGCGQALCGACTVHLDGAPVRSCQTLVGDAAGASITTIEGLNGRVPKPCSRSGRRWTCRNAATASPARSCRPSRCSTETPKPTDEDIDAAMTGNLCRCATYHRIRGAIHEAARQLEA